jgi:sodium-dependent dicarboxylate transporter 2/3/5
MPKTQKRMVVPLCVSALLLLAAFLMPAAGALTQPMLRALLLIAAAIYMWVTQPLPIGSSSLLIIALMPLLGLTESLNEALAGFTTPAQWFIISSFGFALAVKRTTVTARLIRALLKVCGESSAKIAAAFMLCTYIISMFMSDVAAVVLMLSFAGEVAQLAGSEAEKARLSRLIYIAIPFGSILGGTATPVGSTINIMALNILKQHSGIDVGFVHWVALGLPTSFLTVLFAAFVLTRLYRSENLNREKVLAYAGGSDTTPQKNEPLVLAIVGAMLVAWIASSWVKALDTTTVAIVGLALMLLPGIQAFTWKEFKEEVPWEIPIMGSATIVLGSVAVKTGLTDFAVNGIINTFPGLGMTGLVVLLGVMVTFALVAVPVGPAVVSMTVVPVYLVATALGLNPAVAVIVVGIFASNSTILPLNAVFLITYAKRFWTIPELIRMGAIVTVFWIAVCAALIPPLARAVLPGI